MAGRVADIEYACRYRFVVVRHTVSFFEMLKGSNHTLFDNHYGPYRWLKQYVSYNFPIALYYCLENTGNDLDFSYKRHGGDGNRLLQTKMSNLKESHFLLIGAEGDTYFYAA